MIPMQWLGTWKNQYGSILRITRDEASQIAGTFETALRDSSFFGDVRPVIGVHSGNCIGFAFCTSDAADGAIATFSGRLVEGQLQTVWHVVANKPSWPHAVMTNADTFERA
ncbi:avidin/streptavidin family protein [Bradyrhizobium sp. STM 3843]|uniref:avidin/streptavidin family protein n=1 Tax=Bradyrhizobium sp. STM 3843 TaxID=551947 RepID=UPI001FCC8545|nr:avidin/streptavidin family protein [Bradyrhizobium sp. STM 3843]